MEPENTFSVPFDEFDSTYGAVGLSSMSDASFKEKPPSLSTLSRMSAPKGVNPIKYITNVMKLSPVDTKTMKFGDVPEGVMRLGGTFVLKRKEEGEGNMECIYRHEDEVPGDHPEIGEVLKWV
ncbi:hypothetical protein TrVE_jg2063 [Triparma verrucosa]|uniref:Uncharacterized protein n=1 Tax=Triparma verrucosa TaxID=1606542 RepID=A0A9W7BTA0_9STRA|nr:hypothetical protein TrVE_jg2063 [Triparma verrucosa]